MILFRGHDKLLIIKMGSSEGISAAHICYIYTNPRLKGWINR